MRSGARNPAIIARMAAKKRTAAEPEEKRPPGRPPASGVTRDGGIRIRLAAAELEQLAQVAADAGKKPIPYAREVLIAHLKRRSVS